MTVRIEQIAPSIVLLSLLSTACPGLQSEEELRAAALREPLIAACPQPDWWDRVSTDGIEIRTYSELIEYWQDDERSKDQFFKAAYQAITSYPQDTALVATAINLLPNVQGSYRHMTSCLEFAVDRYFDWDRPLGGYAGKPGDTVAGIVRDLARRYTAQGEHGKAISLIERLLEVREREVNDQLLELLSLTHARALADSGQVDRAIGVLRRAIEKYHGDWEDRLRERLDRYESGDL